MTENIMMKRKIIETKFKGARKISMMFKGMFIMARKPWSLKEIFIMENPRFLMLRILKETFIMWRPRISCWAGKLSFVEKSLMTIDRELTTTRMLSIMGKIALSATSRSKKVAKLMRLTAMGYTSRLVIRV